MFYLRIRKFYGYFPLRLIFYELPLYFATNMYLPALPAMSQTFEINASFPNNGSRVLFFLTAFTLSTGLQFTLVLKLLLINELFHEIFN